MTIPVIAFVGRSGAGKTTLLVQLIQELRQRGCRVATIKHHSHDGFEVDQPGKDSWRFAQAGSSHVILAAPSKIASRRDLSQELTLEEITKQITGVDLILVEGYKQANVPTVEVVRAGNSLDIVGRAETRLAVASDVPLSLGVPQFALSDVSGIADLIENCFLRGQVSSSGADLGTPRLAKRPQDDTVRTSYREALRQTLEQVTPLGAETVGLSQACGRVLVQDLFALVDSPSLDSSLKDGYAVLSEDIGSANPQNPVRLRLAGVAAAGQAWTGEMRSGSAVRILTGAPIPRGAQAVVSNEFATDDGQTVTVLNDAKPGRNIMQRGSDISEGQSLAMSGDVLRPTLVGLLAAAGHAELPVFALPRVAILATGDEVVAPGQPLAPGRLYASNVVTLAAWCSHYGFTTTMAVVPDEADAIRAKLLAHIETHDAILTSGGAWSGERDLVVGLLDELGWQKVYHRVRIGPGKGVGFGLWRGRPVFCLPGGPPSNHTAFLQLALPGLLRLGGHRDPGLPALRARLASPLRGQRDWTQFIHGRLTFDSDGVVFIPMRQRSRLQELAVTEAVAMIPEGVEQLPAGAVVRIQILAYPTQ